MSTIINKLSASLTLKLHDKFWRNNLIFFFGSIGVGLLNYLYYPILGRLMTLHQFGELQVLFSILLDVVVVFSALGMVIVNITANTIDDYTKSNIVKIEQAAAGLLSLLFAAWLAFTPLLAGFLKIDSNNPVIALYVVIIISLLISTRQAFIQGVQDFLGVTVGSLLAAGAKLLFSVIFVAMGFGVTGAIAGLALGQLCGVIYVSFRSIRHGLRFPLLGLRLRDIKIKQLMPDLRYILPTLLVSLSIAMLYSVDTIIVKHFFSSDQAGQYAGVATIARIILFVTTPIVLVMFASVKLGNHPHQNRQLLRRSVMMVIATGGSALLFFAIFPQFTIELLLGAQYTGFASLLPKLALALLMVSLVNALLYYDLALRRRRAIWIGLSGIVAMAITVQVHHAAVSQVIDDILYSAIFMLSVSLVVCMINVMNKKKMRGLTE